MTVLQVIRPDELLLAGNHRPGRAWPYMSSPGQQSGMDADLAGGDPANRIAGGAGELHRPSAPGRPRSPAASTNWPIRGPWRPSRGGDPPDHVAVAGEPSPCPPGYPDVLGDLGGREGGDLPAVIRLIESRPVAEAGELHCPVRLGYILHGRSGAGEGLDCPGKGIRPDRCCRPPGEPQISMAACRFLRPGCHCRRRWHSAMVIRLTCCCHGW